MNILPDAATELEFFAAHNSDLGPNGHKYRREESVNLQPTAQSFTESYIKIKLTLKRLLYSTRNLQPDG